MSPYPHVLAGSDFATVGDIFGAATNPDRKKAFDIRTVMRAVADQDHPVLERWAGMADAETAVVTDVHLGGIPVCLIGIERAVGAAARHPADGRPGRLHRRHAVPALEQEGRPRDQRLERQPARRRPGQPVRLRRLAGVDAGAAAGVRAEIGRAIVNFDGPIVFVVVSRYHGGAFVVFSKALNERMTVLAVDGSFASVLGGAPAAAVVFSADVDARTAADPRVTAAEKALADAGPQDRAAFQVALTDTRTSVRAEKLGEVASQFDGIHSIRRAVQVGAVDKVIQASELRPEIVAALEASLG